MAVVGAVVGRLVPEVAGPGADATSRGGRRRARGYRAAVLGLVIYFLLLSGFEGA